MARWLVISEPLVPSDLIVVLGGDGERVGEGVKLFQRGLGRYVMFTAASPLGPEDGPPSYEPGDAVSPVIPWRGELKRVLQAGSFPSESLILDGSASSTCEEARVVREVMERRGFRSAIVVSSPYHMRRIRWVFRHLIEKDSVRIHLHPVIPSWFRVADWWTFRRGVWTLLAEYFKLVHDFATC